jgi:hypothetical protein
VAVAWPQGHGGFGLVFDPRTFTFLGVGHLDAVLNVAIVDKVGQVG